MKRASAVILSLVLSLSVLSGQEHDRNMSLSLDEVISIARDSAIRSLQARQVYEAARLDWSAYQASRRWKLALSVNPNYEKLAMGPEIYSIGGASSTHSLSAGATLDVEKLVGGTGGYLYASSNMAWSEYFGRSAQAFNDIYGSSRMFGTTPVRIGYRQELVGYNQAAWEERQEKKRMETSGHEYAGQLAEITETAAQYFFSYASAKALYDMYRVNAESADSLYKIGCRKYDITAIRKDELISLQLQLLNTQNSVRSSRRNMEQALLSLLSFINVRDIPDSLDVVLPATPDHILDIDPEVAVEMARRYNPAFGQAEEALIMAERDVDRTRREKGAQVNLDVSVGLQKYGPDMRSLGAVNDPYAMGNVTLAVPIVDHGMRRDRYNAAKVRLEYQRLQERELDRVVREEVTNTVKEVMVQQQMLQETSSAMSLADESFRQNQYNYAQGLCDINTFTFAQSRKDEAHINYINALSSFWTAYYRLCRLTLYDFLTGEPLM